MFMSTNRLLVGRGRSVVTAQVEQAVALFREADGRHHFRVTIRALVGDGLKAPTGLLHQWQGLLCSACSSQHPAKE